jgi:hypothetical protein
VNPTTAPAPAPVYVLAPPTSAAPSRPWMHWLIGAALAILAQRYGLPITLPTLPTVPPSTSPTSPPTSPPSNSPTSPPSSSPTTPPAPAPAPAPAPKLDPVAAIGRITFGRSGCTAAPIEPRRPDGRYLVLTAAHCVTEVGQRGTLVMKDRRTVGVQVVALDKTADVCWLITDSTTEVLPTLRLADRSPAPGARVWHAGYGVDRPANREDGTVSDTRTSSGKIGFRINVSSGDSGGPIIMTDGGEVVSCVCCTTERGALADVFGASPEAIRRLRPTVVDDVDWAPAPIPLCGRDRIQ